MTDNKRPPAPLRDRMSNAHPATKRVVRSAVWCGGLSGAIVVLAFYKTALSPVGILTHPPIWLLSAAHLIAALCGGAAVFAALYLIPIRRKWPTGVIMGIIIGIITGAVCYALTFSAFAWGLPNLTASMWAQPTAIQAVATGSTKLTNRRTVGCTSRVTFGAWYAPGGSVCYGVPNPNIMIGSTFFMQGQGNSWATRITQIDRTNSR